MIDKLAGQREREGGGGGSCLPGVSAVLGETHKKHEADADAASQ